MTRSDALDVRTGRARAAEEVTGMSAPDPEVFEDIASTSTGATKAHIALRAACGALARTAANLVCFPIDTIKTRMQASAATTLATARLSLPTASATAASAALSLSAGRAATITTTLASTQRSLALGTLAAGLPFGAGLATGLGDLFRGVRVAAGSSLASGLVFWAVHDGVRSWLEDGWHMDRSNAATIAASSSAATLASAFIRVPADVLKHKVQARLYPNVQRAWRGVLQNSRAQGLYSGFGVTLLRDMPEAALQLAAYTQLRAWYGSVSSADHSRQLFAAVNQPGAASASADHHHSHQLFGLSQSISTPHRPHQALRQGPASSSSSSEHSLQVQLALGGAAGALSSLATTPLDCLKTRMQLSGLSLPGALAEAVGGGRGLAGLFRGAGPRVLQAGLGSAVFFALFEGGQAELRRRLQGQQQRGMQKAELLELAACLHESTVCLVGTAAGHSQGVRRVADSQGRLPYVAGGLATVLQAGHVGVRTAELLELASSRHESMRFAPGAAAVQLQGSVLPAWGGTQGFTLDADSSQWALQPL